MFAFLVRQPAGRAADQGVRGADDARPASRRFRCSRSRASCSPKGKSSERLLRAVPRVRRLGAGRHGGRGRDAVRVLHAVHRRVGRDDPRARRAAAAGAREGRLPRAVLDRPAHRVGIARPALPAVAAADAVRHRVAEGVDRGSVHRRAAAGPADARPRLGARRARGPRREAPAACRSASREAVRRAVGSEVGAAAAGVRAGRVPRRHRDARRVARRSPRSTRSSSSGSSTATCRPGATCCA